MNFVALDIETTGFSQRYDTIIQLAAVKVVNDKVVDEFNQYIYTTKKLSQKIIEITGITNDLLEKEGQPYSKVLTEFLWFIGDMELVAHNAQFDLRFLKQKIKVKLGIDLDNKYFCTYQLAKKIYPQLPDHKLDTVATHLGIPNIKHHDALNDAKVCADILMKIVGKEPVATRHKSPLIDLLNTMRVTIKNNKIRF